MNYVPPKRYVEVLLPSTSECDLIWFGVAVDTGVGGAPNPIQMASLKRRGAETDTQGKRHAQTEAKIGLMRPHAKGPWSFPESQQKEARRRHGRVPLQLSEAA